MLTLREALKRKKVFDESGRWQTAELVLLGQEAFINRWNFKPNYYLMERFLKPVNSFLYYKPKEVIKGDF